MLFYIFMFAFTKKTNKKKNKCPVKTNVYYVNVVWLQCGGTFVFTHLAASSEAIWSETEHNLFIK